MHTLDLVVLAVEWGHGRRTGKLSNLHLGARAEDGSFVMLGKTFKGLTDALLDWQTEQLLARAVGDDGHVVTVRPELVVEIAYDGVQTSPRYPAGLTLRFARVLRYRDDKTAQEADTIDDRPGGAHRRLSRPRQDAALRSPVRRRPRRAPTRSRLTGSRLLALAYWFSRRSRASCSWSPAAVPTTRTANASARPSRRRSTAR